MAKKEDSSWTRWRYFGDLLPTKVNYQTRKKIEECSFSWTIQNFNFVLMGEQPGFCIKSTSFPSNTDKTFKWTIEFLPLGTNEYKDVSIVHLVLNSVPQFNSKAKCDMVFRNVNNSKLFDRSINGVFSPGVSGQKLRLMVYQDILFQKLSLENDNNDILNIEVKIMTAVEDFEDILEIKESPCQQEISLNALLKDLSLLFTKESQKLSDVIINAKGSKFHVHQAILVSRSSVFAAMLQNDTKEKHDKLIEIEDIEPDIMEKMLHFIYDSHIEYNDVNEAMQILEAFEKYNVETLKSSCEDYLMFNLNIGNVLNVLNVADFYNAILLRSKAIKYICENKDSFIDPEKFINAKIKRANLLTDILVAIADVK